METIPVAITHAKYPGNRSAAACKMKFLRFGGLVIEGLFVTPFAVKFKPDSRIATFGSENPVAFSQRRIVPHVLPVTTFQNRTPVVFFILLKASDLLLHRLLSELRM
jgi:hypothetical protein